MVKIVEEKHIPLEPKAPMNWGFMICQVTYWSGVLIGMEITALLLRQIQQDLQIVVGQSCTVVVNSVSILKTAVQPLVGT